MLMYGPQKLPSSSLKRKPVFEKQLVLQEEVPTPILWAPDWVLTRAVPGIFNFRYTLKC